jgi:NAD(P)-dependent dehydrogenase (short-subunit alcohol dehydrogenase family)
MATAAARYAQLQRARNSVLNAAREAARVTIPGLIPQEGASDPHDIAEQPYESLGARGVNNVAAKLLLSLFPPQRPFFKLQVDAETADQMGAKLGKAEEALAGISRMAMALVEVSGSRPLWMEVFRHLIVAGNILIYHPDDGSPMRVWRLDQYVVRRDAQGRMLEAVIEEEVYPSELDDAVRAAVQLDQEEPDEKGEPSDKAEEKVKLYTFVKVEGDNVIHFEEINGIEVPGSRGTANKDVSGWQALRWQAVPGSDYGRSMVTEYAGDFLSLEEGWQAVIKFAAEAARIITIVDPNAGVDVEELAEAESGDHITGFVDKINKLGLEKSADFTILWNVIQSIERRVSQAFLLTANTIRDAERVTAEEIRAVAQELEDAFGGTYTVLSAEAQTPYARRVLYILGKQGNAPAAKQLLKNVNTQIVTGFSALGQNTEVQAITEWLQGLVNLFGPQAVAQAVDFQEVAYRTGTGRGIEDVKGMLKDPQTIANEQAGAMQQDVTSKVAPEIVKGGMKALQDNPAIQEAINAQAEQ